MDSRIEGLHEEGSHQGEVEAGHCAQHAHSGCSSAGNESKAHHAMGHHHGHHHGHGELSGPRLFWASIVNFGFALLEIIGGLLSNSLSLISDAVHNLTDATSIFIAYIANRLGRRKHNARHTFGYRRAEILAALFNAVVLIAICLYLFVEAFRRLRNPEVINSKLMLIVALAGLLANVVAMVILHSSRRHNLNVRAAYMHLLGDTLSSVAVIAGGIAMLYGEWYWIDPLITVLVGAYIIWQTWGIVRESTEILMQAVPPELDVYKIQDYLNGVEGVACAHHIHLWRLTDEALHIEAHIELDRDMRASESAMLLEKLTQGLHEQYGITHVTLQMEYRPDHDARQAICQCD